jgi:transcription elongation factor GreA
MGTSVFISILSFAREYTMNEREQLENEIDRLKYELSVTIPQEMQDAVEMGDLRENSEYTEIVTRQQFAGIRLAQLLQRLSAYKNINIKHIPKDKVGMGSIITAYHVEQQTIKVFKIVFAEISDDTSEVYTEITSNSPIGKSLYNKTINEQVIVSLPSGKATYKILELVTIHDIQKGS